MSSTLRTVGLVARREYTSRASSKAFLISNAVMLVLLVVGIVVASLVGGSSDATKVGLVGTAEQLAAPLQQAGTSLGEDLETSVLPDAEQARAQVRDGDLEAVVLPSDSGGYVAVVDKELSPELQAAISATVRQQAVDTVLRANDVDPAVLAQAVQQAGPTVEALNPPDPASAQRTALAYLAVLSMFFLLLMFGLYVAMGVVEEKSSRVVEVLLATIKPLHLLWGKVIGIGAIGLTQLVGIGAVALVAGVATDLVTVTGTAVAVFASVLVWFILGYTLFAVLYAAAGSLVSRQEDVNSVVTPITSVIIAMYVLAQVTLGEPDGTLAAVMSWIPPFSAMLMPMRIAAGVSSPGQVIGSALLMLAVTVALSLLAARIYERSVLRSGSRVSLREALRS
ncbi:ABC transporter permease [Rhodococcus sp. X156]|uniref:ABC transporter permease n=1 Tax=Rhodococcus sp. X156 TaxID=2499145 RepID=UPI000FD7690A|nr:ABC transporter permease [Rhodococcus sp. X156]